MVVAVVATLTALVVRSKTRSVAHLRMVSCLGGCL